MTLSICFVTETARHDRPLLDPAARYRCAHPAEALQTMGARMTILSAERFFAAPPEHHDVYVFHRPSAARPGFDAVLDRLTALGRRLVADYDDLIFGDAEVACDLPAVRTGRQSPEQAVEQFAANLAALHRFDRVSVATAPLGREVALHRPRAQIRVTPNVVPAGLRRAMARTGLARRPRARARIGYFAGTSNHGADLAEVSAVLHRVLIEDRQAALFVMGPVALPHDLAILPNVQVAQAVPYTRLPAWMALCTTVIAPLEATRFNACKSRVKFLEAALAGCRLVASPIPDMVAVGAPHLTLADTSDTWYAALSAPPPPADLALLQQANQRYIDDHCDCGPLADLIGA